ncbi:MAG: hypothetical protein ABSC64_02735 [Candidatus Korobacteraceae bacterium]|jgi:DNA polymerase elongation subunit (family B)
MDYKQRSNEQIGRTRTSGDRRTVVLDIETAALDSSDEKGALDAMTGRVVCIGMLIDDGNAATEIVFAREDDRVIISDSWNAMRPGDVIVGHNVLDFDIRFLRQRSWILGIEPSRAFDTRRYYTADVVDTLQLWTSWSDNKKGVTLDAIGSVLAFLVAAGKLAKARTLRGGGRSAISTA